MTTSLARSLSKWARHVNLHDGDVIVVANDCLDDTGLDEFLNCLKKLHYKNVIVVRVPTSQSLESITALNQTAMNKLGWYHVSQVTRKFHARLEVIRPEREAYEPKESNKDGRQQPRHD